MELQTKKIYMIASIMMTVGIFVAVVGNAVIGSGASLVDLSGLYSQKMNIDQSLSKSLLEQKKINQEVDRLRKERKEVQEQIDKAIHEPKDNYKEAFEPPSCHKHTAGEDQNQYVRMASEISGNDIKFLALVDSENGLWTIDRIHDDGQGRGFCGISYPWHKNIIEDERFYTDAYWQLSECYRLWKGGTKFYGKWQNSLKNFTCG